MATSERSQAFVPVKEIRSGVVVLKDGGYRGILMCSSVNFSLKSEDEQRAIVSGFQNFLNTLDFSIQIVVHSRKMDIRPYLSLLTERAKEQKTELMKIQLREYLEFVRTFTEGTNIMTKTFYVVVPYAPNTGFAPSAAGLFARATQKSEHKTSKETFDEEKVQLEQRMALIIAGLQSSGIRAIPLGTEETIELFYRSFNPGELENPIRLEA